MNIIPKAVIFDWDNTLLDTWPLIHDAIDKTMVKMGKEPWGLEKVKNNVHKSMRESFPAIFGDKWQEAGKFYKNSYKENHLENLVMLPNSLELIEKLYNLNIKLFVVSNKVGTTLREEIKHLEIEKYFFAAIGAHDAKEDKPSKEPVELALMGSDINPKDDLVWFIGDSFVDIECAMSSNCQPILFNEENKLSFDLKRRVSEYDKGPLIHFKNHQEIIEYLG